MKYTKDEEIVYFLYISVFLKLITTQVLRRDRQFLQFVWNLCTLMTEL